jgi:DNA-binding beta-propeller fold protein YncE
MKARLSLSTPATVPCRQASALGVIRLALALAAVLLVLTACTTYTVGVLTYHPGVLFSPDSRKVAYVALKGDTSFLVINETKGTDYDFIGHFGCSQDGNHIAFTAKKGDRMVIVIDGKERAAYASVPAGPVFRSDGAL